MSNLVQIHKYKIPHYYPSQLIWFLVYLMFISWFTFTSKGYNQLIKLSNPIRRVVIIEVTPVPNKIQPRPQVAPIQQLVPKEWGVAKQLNDVTWTILVGQDEAMATPQEILEALNQYRNTNGSGSLNWDNKLAEFAQTRADYFAETKDLDQHAGFIEYTNSEDNMRNLGFRGVGENASYGYKLAGVHLIEWVFAGDEPHDKNQRNPDWTHVGIGVSDTGVDLIFGKSKI